MDGLLERLAGLAGLLAVLALFALIYYALPYWPYIAIGVLVLGGIAGLFGGVSNSKSNHNPLEGSYNVYTTDPEGTTTFTRQTISKNHWRS